MGKRRWRLVSVAGALVTMFAPMQGDLRAQTPSPQVSAATADNRSATDDPCPERGYLPVRHDEDYDFLRNAECRTGAFDALKLLPVGSRPGLTLSFGGEVRQRFERYSEYDFGDQAGPTNGYYDARYMLAADLRAEAGWRVFAQLRHGEEHGRPGPRRLAYDGGPDVHELFVELPISATALVRLGRQEIALPRDGVRRLLSMREGPNSRRSWDGVFTSVPNVSSWSLKAFYAREVEPRPSSFDDASSEAVQFWGFRAERRLSTALAIDLYYFGLAETRAPEVEDQPNRRHTLGGRVSTPEPVSGWTLDAEAAAQAGQAAGDEVLAGFFAIDVSYAIPDHPLELGFVGRLAAFSGGRGGDGRNETFDTLYLTGGYVNDGELLRGSNLVTARFGMTLAPLDGVTARLSWDEYRRASAADGIYSVGGAPLRSEASAIGLSTSAKRVGGTLGADVAWQITPDVDLSMVAGRFLPGRYIRDTAATRAESVDYVTMDARLRF